MRNNIYTSGEYLSKHPNWHVEDSPWKASQILKMIARNKLQPHSICEVGCGAGEILNQLYHKMPNDISFTGYEISPQAFEFCKQRMKERLQFKLTNLLEDNSAFFDIVLAIDVFEHIENHFDFLRKLREKGTFKIFHIPLDICVLNLLRSSDKLGPFIGPRTHVHCFTKEMALATLNETGYEILDYFYTAGAIDLPAKSLKGSLARLPRKILYKLNRNIGVRILGGFSLMVLTK